MASLVEVCVGIAKILKDECELRSYAYVPEKPEVPAALVTLGEAEIITFKLGQYDLPMRVTILTSTANDRAGQEQLMSFVDFDSPTSVWRAFYNNRDLGFGVNGGVDSAVKKYEPLGTVEIGGVNYYAGAFDLIVVVSPAPTGD